MTEYSSLIVTIFEECFLIDSIVIYKTYIFYDIRYSRNKLKLFQYFLSMVNFYSFMLCILKPELLRLYDII